MRNQKTQRVRWHQFLWQYFHAHYLAFQISFRNLSLTPMATFITMAAIGVCLCLPSCLYLFIKNIHHVSQGFEQGSAITLYLDPKATSAQVQGVISKVKEYPYVERTIYISPEKALKEFQESSGLKDMLALLPENPLPGVINIQMDTKKTSRADLNAMKIDLAKISVVKQAAFDYDWVEKLNVFLSFGKILSHCLYLIIGIGVVLMVGNTIRLALERHRSEIEVLNLVGATNAYIRRPFLYRGLLYGGLGGVIALLIMNLVIHALKDPVQELSSLYQGIFVLQSLKFYDTVMLLAASAGLGWIGAAIAFQQQIHTLVKEN
jgi:cell division transport system permease protein